MSEEEAELTSLQSAAGRRRMPLSPPPLVGLL